MNVIIGILIGIYFGASYAPQVSYAYHKTKDFITTTFKKGNK